MLEETWPGHSSCSGCQNQFCSAEAPMYLCVMACRAQRLLLYECRGAGTASAWAGAWVVVEFSGSKEQPGENKGVIQKIVYY